MKDMICDGIATAPEGRHFGRLNSDPMNQEPCRGGIIIEWVRSYPNVHRTPYGGFRWNKLRTTDAQRAAERSLKLRTTERN